MSASVSGKRWRLRDETPPTGAPSANELMARLLQLRGVTSREDARRFLQPAMPDPSELLPNLPVALDRLVRALRDGERIAVYGDYDADGMTGAAILVEGLTELGGSAFAYIPDRFSEGYGLNVAALRSLRDAGADLLVTVDTGTSAAREVAYANERGLDVIVVDHHVPKATLPDALALINPHLDGTDPAYAHLSGCGVAYTVLLALAARLGRSFDPERYADLAAIGTVADVVPLLGVNRPLVATGLARIAGGHRPGLAALMNVARIAGERPTTHTIGFRIAPRLNAAGRLATALTAFELLTTTDEARACALAGELEALNRRRQQLTDEALHLSRALADAECAGAPLVMVGHPSIHQGIAGLVAGKLADERARPAIVYQHGAEFSTGSARSVPAFDIHETLERAAHLLERFGGHHQAGGFKVRSDRLDELRRVLTDWTGEQRDWDSFIPEIEVDLELPVHHTLPPRQMLALVRQLEPCGPENPAPLFLGRGALVWEARRVGNGGKHLRLRLSDGRSRRGWTAIAFGLGEHAPRPGTRIDLVYSVAVARYEDAELHIVDFAPSEA